MIEKTKLAGWLLAGMLAGGPVQAALVDRGGGMIYDTDLNITWLKDANYAKTSGYDSDGLMNWNAANAWASSLVYGGYSDWRLPTTTDLGTAGCNFAFSSTDCGYNVATNSSELAHLFFVELGNKSAYDTTGTFRGGSSGVNWGVVNSGPFQNIQSYVYWSGTLDELDPVAWYFHTSYGRQGNTTLNNEHYAWAVRSGDIAAAPEPGSVLLVGMALAGMMTTRRRRSLGAS